MRSAEADPTVERYLAALAAHDWDALASTLAPDVVRVGPYGDVYRGADAYASFLRETIDALVGYALVVERTHVAASTVTVELHETVDDGDDRLRTHEAVVFDVRDGRIARVAVYLQSSVRLP